MLLEPFCKMENEWMLVLPFAGLKMEVEGGVPVDADGARRESFRGIPSGRERARAGQCATASIESVCACEAVEGASNPLAIGGRWFKN